MDLALAFTLGFLIAAWLGFVLHRMWRFNRLNPGATSYTTEAQAGQRLEELLAEEAVIVHRFPNLERRRAQRSAPPE